MAIASFPVHTFGLLFPPPPPVAAAERPLHFDALCRQRRCLTLHRFLVQQPSILACCCCAPSPKVHTRIALLTLQVSELGALQCWLYPHPPGYRMDRSLHVVAAAVVVVVVDLLPRPLPRGPYASGPLAVWTMKGSAFKI